MGIEPTWDSLHCPTPDLKSGSPTSELGTSGRFITEMANHVEGFEASPEKAMPSVVSSQLSVAAKRRAHRAWGIA